MRAKHYTWPVIGLTLPAFVAVWGGWVGIGQMTGFGVINMLPGMVDDGGWATLNTAITLPIGLETYAAYALHTALNAVTPTLKRFAFRSAVAALILGALGQLAFHVMESMGIVTAPWWITAIVAMIPVGVLGAGTSLAALIRRERLELAGRDLAAATQAAPVLDAVQEALTEIGPEVKAVLDQPRRERGPRATSEAQEKAARLVAEGQSAQDAADAAGVPLSTARRYQTVARKLAADPSTDLGKVPGVSPALISIIRDTVAREGRKP